MPFLSRNTWVENRNTQGVVNDANQSMENHPRGLERRLRGEIKGAATDISGLSEVQAAKAAAAQREMQARRTYAPSFLMNSPEQQQQALQAELGDIGTQYGFDATRGASEGLQWRYGLKARLGEGRADRNMQREEDRRRALSDQYFREHQQGWGSMLGQLAAGGLSSFAGGMGSGFSSRLFPRAATGGGGGV